MRTQHEETQYLQIILFSDLSYGKEVAERFGHFTVVDVQETVVQPVTCKNLAVAALALCNLIFMVRENQVFAAGMNINLFTQIFFCHDGTLDMPSRTSLAPWRYPERFSFFFRFPEYEIQRIFFLIFSGYQKGTVTGTQIIQILMR